MACWFAPFQTNVRVKWSVDPTFRPRGGSLSRPSAVMSRPFQPGIGGGSSWEDQSGWVGEEHNHVLRSPHEVHPGSLGRRRDTISGKKDIFVPACPGRVGRGARHLTSFLHQRQRPTATYGIDRYLFPSFAKDRIFCRTCVGVQGISSASDAVSFRGGESATPNSGCLVLSPKSESASIPHRSSLRPGPCVLPVLFHRDLPQDIAARGARYDPLVGRSEKRRG